LKTHFGYDAFRGHQEEIIEHTVNGGDALVLMPTGAGKSLCFQIPSMIRDGIGIVISPLIALMRDQVESLRQSGVKADFLNSSLSGPESYQVRKRAERGEIDLLYISPERLVLDEFQEFLQTLPIALFAIDEAHCVSQWGHDFRKEYLALSVLHERYPNVPRIALTATADEATRSEIIQNLDLHSAKIFISGFDRPNIQYAVGLKHNSNTQLLAFLKSRGQDDSGIIYCMSRKKTEQIASLLTEKGFKAYPYHAGMEPADRERNQDIFINEEGIIMVATVAFGMGIDKSNVRFVCHLDLPKSLESYYQETGRAGRDGLPAIAWMIYGLGDLVMLRQMIQSSESNEDRKRLEIQKLNALLGFCETIECRRKVLLNYFGDEHPEKCGNCDTCITPVTSWDGTREAQMALSTVYRTEQRFGAGYLIDVLRGVTNERIPRFGHDKLKVFGLGNAKTQAEWYSIFRQLIAAGYLTASSDGFGSLELSPASKEILNGRKQIFFRFDPTPLKDKVSKKKVVTTTLSQNPKAQDLFQALRKKRVEIAHRQKVPPYVIFHDKTLLEMATNAPKTDREFLQINGVGESKLARYGKDFLAIIREHTESS